jgi:hypothetical protein
MALVSSPTWTEAQLLTPEELEAMAVIKGEMQGDEYLWDVEYYEPRAEKKIKGGWKSRIEGLKKKTPTR